MGKPVQRIGVSATAWPIEAMARLLCGERPCAVATLIFVKRIVSNRASRTRGMVTAGRIQSVSHRTDGGAPGRECEMQPDLSDNPFGR